MEYKKKLIKTGQKFGRLIVVKEVKPDICKHKNKIYKYRKVLCQCECGDTKEISYCNLKNGSTKSCGCLRKEITKIGNNGRIHGMRHTRFYNIFRGIRNRCNNKNHIGYKNYGGRGIVICEKWLKFENFRDDMLISYNKHCEKFGKKNTQIDRINNDKDYYKKNCRWATQTEQQNNKRK